MEPIAGCNPEDNFHGEKVLYGCYYVAPEAEYSLYEASNDDGKVTFKRLRDSVLKAVEHGVDIINLSQGKPHPRCDGDCPMCVVVERAIEEDVIVVVAAGHQRPDGETHAVYCPAIVEDAIAVSGMTAVCTYDAEEYSGSSYTLPEEVGISEDASLRYCGERGCEDEENFCVRHLEYQPWIGNVNPVGEKPDVLAPVHRIGTMQDGSVGADGGSSFAAPLVTGGISCVLADLDSEQAPIPNPYQMRQALVKSSEPVPGAHAGRMDTFSLYSRLKEKMATVADED